MNKQDRTESEILQNQEINQNGSKIISKFLDRISKESDSTKENFSYNDEHMQEHHDDWTWSDH